MTQLVFALCLNNRLCSSRAISEAIKLDKTAPEARTVKNTTQTQIE